MRANGGELKGFAETCRRKIIQGQNGTSQNYKASEFLHRAVGLNIVNVQHDKKGMLRKRHVVAKSV